MSLAEIVSNYGYYAVLIGTFLEGETVVIIAGFFAHLHYLKLPLVILSAFSGTFIADQFYFYLGRVKGKSFIEKRPQWRQKSKKVFRLLEKHRILLILGFRFLYGVRTVTPFILGISGISPVAYLVLNLIGASIWAMIFGTLGYFFGHSLELIIGEIRIYEKWIFLILALAGLSIWGIYLLITKKR